MKDKIRVAQIMGKWKGGGVESVVMNYYRHIDRSKIQFDFICDEDSTMIPREEIEALGGRVILVPSYPKLPKYISSLKKIFSENKYRIVHSHINTLSVFPLYAAKKAGVKVRIAHSHSTTSPDEVLRNLIKNILKHFSKSFATDYFACSELAGRWLFGDKAFDAGKVTIIHNAIDLDKFKFDAKARKEVRKELNIPDDAFVVGHIGRFVKQKNHTFLIDIFNEVHKEKPNAYLILAGDGPLMPKIKTKVEKLGLKDFVKFLGQRNDTHKLYSAMDVFCLPSLYEGLPVVGVEAQAVGLPCVFSDNITRDTKILNGTLFLSLLNSVDEWTRVIYKKEKILRENPSLPIANITQQASILASKYTELNKIKIAIFGMTTNKGGIETFIRNNLEALHEDDLNFYIFKMTKDAIAHEQLLKNICKEIYITPNEFKRPLGCLLSVMKQLKKNQIDVVHINKNSLSSIIIPLASKLSSIDTRIIHSHNIKSTKGLLANIMHKINRHFIGALATDYFACSELAGRWLFGDKAFDAGKVTIIHNAIDLDKFKFDAKARKEVRKELNIPDDAFVIGHIGRFVKQKNHTFLIDIFNEVHKEKPNAYLILAGDGPLMPKIKTKVEKLGLSESVRFLGQRNDTHKLYSAMDVFCLPSLYEGLGTVAIEAQASGLPCVLSNMVPKEAQISNNTLFLSFDDRAEWDDIVLNFRKFNNRMREIVYDKKYDIDIEVEKLLDVYNYNDQKFDICKKISVIVPTYNSCSTLERCIDSILNQEYGNFEVIVIDDGSTDDSNLLMGKYTNDGRVRYYYVANGGVSHARNLGIEKAVGDIVVFIDSDDDIAEGYFSDIIRYMRNNDVMIYDYNVIVGNKKNIVQGKNLTVNNKKILCDELQKYNLMGPVCNKIYSRDILDDIKFDTKITLGEDFKFFTECLCKASKIQYRNVAFYNYYMTANSHGFDNREKTFHEKLMALDGLKMIYSSCHAPKRNINDLIARNYLKEFLCMSRNGHMSKENLIKLNRYIDECCVIEEKDYSFPYNFLVPLYRNGNYFILIFITSLLSFADNMNKNIHFGLRSKK